MFTKRILFLLFIALLTFSLVSATEVYRCDNGTKTFIKEVSKGDINFCFDEEENNYLLPSGGASGVCYTIENEPAECNTQRRTCYEAIEGKCYDKFVYGTCGYRQFSTLQECIEYVDYHKKLEGGSANTNTLIIIFGSVMTFILLIILIFVIKGKKKK